jgi:hypothetical protein
MAANKVVGTSCYLLEDFIGFKSGLLLDNGSISIQGREYVNLRSTVLSTGVVAGPMSPLLGNYQGGGYRVAWAKLNRPATLDGDTLTSVPTISSGSLVDHGPVLYAELLRDFRTKIMPTAYKAGIEQPCKVGGFPFDTFVGLTSTLIYEERCVPSLAAECGYRWTSPVTGNVLIHFKITIKKPSPTGDGIIATVYARGAPIWNTTLSSGTRMVVGRISAIVPGHTIELRIGSGASAVGDATYVELAFTANSKSVKLDFAV